MVGLAQVVLILQRTQAHIQGIARLQRPAKARHLRLRAHSIGERAPVRAPVAQDVAIDGHTVEPDVVGIPAVLPFRGLQRQVKAIEQLRKMQSD